MPDVEHSTNVAAPIDTVWAFVHDMDNWAPFVTGYQRHEKIDEDHSIWFVKGELGGLTRVAEFKVEVTEWAGPNRVSFTLHGVQEPVSGSGEFLAHSIDGTAPSEPVATVTAKPGFFARLRLRIARWLLRRATHSQDVVPSTAAPSSGGTNITFKLSLSAGGMTGPVMNMLLAPMLAPVAEDLALKIAAGIENRGCARNTGVSNG